MSCCCCCCCCCCYECFGGGWMYGKKCEEKHGRADQIYLALAGSQKNKKTKKKMINIKEKRKKSAKTKAGAQHGPDNCNSRCIYAKSVSCEELKTKANASYQRTYARGRELSSTCSTCFFYSIRCLFCIYIGCYILQIIDLKMRVV